MPLPLTGRRPTVVALFLASASFFYFLFLPHFHSHSFVDIQKHTHLNEPRQITVTTTAITTVTTVLTSVGTSTTRLLPPAISDSRSLSGPTPSSSRSISGSSLSPSSDPSSSTVPLSTSSSSRTTPATTSHFSSSATPRTTSETTLILVPETLLPTPEATFVLTDAILPTSSVATPNIPAPSPAPSDAAVRATSTGFWNNRGAVAGTFTVVALAIVGIIAMLITICIKRTRKLEYLKGDEEIWNNLSEPRSGSSPGDNSLSDPPLDPFAAGEIVQYRGSGSSFPTVNGIVPAANHVGGHSSDDGHNSSHGHSSSNHHGFSSISYHSATTESRTSPSSSGQQGSPLSQPHTMRLSSQQQLHKNSPGTPRRPPVHFSQDHKLRQVESDASYYADQMHLYYYGASSPPIKRFAPQTS